MCMSMCVYKHRPINSIKCYGNLKKKNYCIEIIYYKFALNLILCCILDTRRKIRIANVFIRTKHIITNSSHTFKYFEKY